MDCAQARRALPTHLDDECATAQALQVEAHLATCATCAALAARQRALGDGLRRALPRAAPAALRARAQALVAAAAAPAAAATPAPARPRGHPPRWRAGARGGLLAAAAALAVTWLAARWCYQPAAADALAHDLVAMHVRALLPGHLTDVLSSDHHTVKPWFTGRLDYAPWVEDLAGAGFPLLGGRVDYVAGQRVAVLAFTRGQHLIDLVVRPLAQGDGRGLPEATAEGYHLRAWSAAGRSFVAISDAGADELAAFATAVRAAAEP